MFSFTGEEPLVLFEYRVLRGLQHGIEAAQHDHREHDERKRPDLAV